MSVFSSLLSLCFMVGYIDSAPIGSWVKIAQPSDQPIAFPYRSAGIKKMFSRLYIWHSFHKCEYSAYIRCCYRENK